MEIVMYLTRELYQALQELMFSCLFITTNGKVWSPLHWKMIWVFTGHTSYCPKKCFPNFHVPLTSFIPPFSATESTICIGLSIPILKVLYMPVSYAFLLKKKMLYNLTLKVSAFLSLSGFRHDLCDITVTSMRFLHAGQGNLTVAFSEYFHIYFRNLYWNENVPELCVVAGGASEQTHENLRRGY